MLAKLRARLGALSHSLGIQTALRDRAVRRMKKRHATQKRYERQSQEAMKVADRLRAEGHRQKAKRKDKKSAKLDAKATRECHRAVFWRGRARALTQRVEGVELDIQKTKREIAKLGVTIDGNVAKGGTPFERWLAVQNASVANCATGKRRNFYSMAGAWDVNHVIVPGEQYGERSDCSSTVTGWAKAAGLPDPNGADWTGGYTGTLQQGHNGWREVSFSQMVKAKKPAFFIYGSGTGHHTEGWCPVVNARGAVINANRTAGHGSAPVDYGVPDLFGDGDFRCFIYEGK